MFACSRVAGWSAHILEQKRTGRLFRPSARYVGPANRRLTKSPALRSQLTLAEAAASADELAQRGAERDLARCARSGPTSSRQLRQRRLPGAGGRLSRDRPVPVPPEARAAPGAGSRTRARPAAAPPSSRSSSSRVTRRARSTRSGRCCTRSRTPTESGGPPARDRLLRNGSPQRDTRCCSSGPSGATTDAQLRETAKRVARLKKKAARG